MVNTLVTHKKFNLGIGCISKEFKNEVNVNFGLDDTKKCKLTSLNIIDTSNSKTVTFLEFKNRIMQSNSTLNDVIVGNELKHYVGIGWTTTRVVTFDDLTKYPRVI
jgi:hypothetical protein